MKKILLICTMVFAIGFTNLNATKLQEFNAQASNKVKELVKEHSLEVVDYDYVKKAVSIGTRQAAKAIILDARPKKLYEAGHIPTAYLFLEKDFNKYYKDILSKVSKEKEIIIYCGGYNCTKSPTLAILLLKKGYKNIKIYAAGMPQWSSKNYEEIELNYANAMYEKRLAFFIDTRGFSLFQRGTILGAINIPDTQFKKFTGFLPANVNTAIITFCAGYECAKSHNVANYLVSMGYVNVKTLASGFPSWKKASYATTGTAFVKKELEVPMKEVKTFLKKGEDTGTVDGNWFVKNYSTFPKNITVVDVRSYDEYKEGHLKEAINIHAEKMQAQELLEALPKDGEIIFMCGTGTRAMEAWVSLAQKLKYKDIHRVFYLDANTKCTKSNKCEIEVNEPLGI